MFRMAVIEMIVQAMMQANVTINVPAMAQIATRSGFEDFPLSSAINALRSLGSIGRLSWDCPLSYCRRYLHLHLIIPEARSNGLMIQPTIT